MTGTAPGEKSLSLLGHLSRGIKAVSSQQIASIRLFNSHS